jgi:FtsP/CotA-like multicopper oxidase with cupredoxin domain
MDLEARQGIAHYMADRETPVWTYNGTVPGPLIDAKVGDQLVVHFRNNLPEPTTIHWHGIRLPNAMDGALAVQDPVPPGGTFEYSFVLRDAGLYWFHPHVRSDEQIAKGLYGVIRVRGADEPAADEEHILVLDDVTLDEAGSLPPHVDDYGALPDRFKRHGRLGNMLLVNGKVSPRLRFRAGGSHRLRLLNTANSRYFDLSVPGHFLRVLGTDGGFFEKPYDVDDLVVAPAERFDVMIILRGAPGNELPLNTLRFQRAEDDILPLAQVATLRLVDDAFTVAGALPLGFPAVARLPSGAVETLVFGEGLQGKDQDFEHHPPLSPGDPVFTINGKAGRDIPLLRVDVGDVRVLDVVNQTHEAHVFHLHGFFFQLLSVDGASVPSDRIVNKDTMNLAQSIRYQLAVRFDAPGTWMYHCHIPEHSERGMMGEIEVRP